MRHRPLPPALALASALALLGGCAEMHRGVEAVGRIGAPAAEADAAPATRPDVKTVRPRGAPRAPVADMGSREPRGPRTAVASAVPSPAQIFDFHPPGSRPDGWRQPFVIDTSDGPLAADVRRSGAELRAFLADHKAGGARAAEAARLDGTRPDGTAAGMVRKRCSEMDVAAARPGCGVPRPQAAAAAPQ